VNTTTKFCIDWLLKRIWTINNLLRFPFIDVGMVVEATRTSRLNFARVHLFAPFILEIIPTKRWTFEEHGFPIK
jgi:hypothetical protein